VALVRERTIPTERPMKLPTMRGFSNLFSLNPSQVHTQFSYIIGLCRPLMLETKFQNHTNCSKIIVFHILIFTLLQQIGRQKFMDRIIASFTRNVCTFNFFMNQVLICYSRCNITFSNYLLALFMSTLRGKKTQCLLIIEPNVCHIALSLDSSKIS
jgi:hypothetical protein